MTEKKKYKQPTASPAHTRASVKYNASHTVQFPIKLNLDTDADIIEHLENLEESKRGYVLRLIREDMQRNP